MNEREEGRSEFVVARSDAPKVLDARKEALDQIAVSVEMTIETALVSSIGTGRDHGLRASGLDHGNEMIGVVALVRNDSLNRQALDGLGGTIDVGDLAGRENDPQRIAKGIDRDMQFGRQSAPRATDVLTAGFFWAPAEC